MPKKQNQINSGVVQDCRGESREGKTAVQCDSAVQRSRNLALGRGEESDSSPDPLDSRGQGPTGKGRGTPMSIRSEIPRPSKRKHHTEVRIQYGDEPARVLVFCFPVEVDVRPVTKRAA